MSVPDKNADADSDNAAIATGQTSEPTCGMHYVFVWGPAGASSSPRFVQTGTIIFARALDINGKITKLAYNHPQALNLMRRSTPLSNRAKLNVMSLTDAAAERVKAIVGNSDKPIAGIRVGVKNGGCAGMSYTVEYAETINPLDEVVEDKGVRVLVDPRAILFLLGTQMDVKTDKFSSTFVFNNPNETSACGCGESVAITPAKELAEPPAALEGSR
jgi:iron-sulfur cluster assembly protein